MAICHNILLSQYPVIIVIPFTLDADAFDHDLMFNCLKDIQEAKPTKVPVYDFKTNSRK